MVCRVREESPAEAVRLRVLAQISTRMSSESSAGMPASLSILPMAFARPLVPPASSPGTKRSPELCPVIPGSAMAADMATIAPIMCSVPATAPMRSALSSPFNSGMTTVSFPIMGMMASAACSRS